MSREHRRRARIAPPVIHGLRDRKLELAIYTSAHHRPPDFDDLLEPDGPFVTDPLIIQGAGKLRPEPEEERELERRNRERRY